MYLDRIEAAQQIPFAVPAEKTSLFDTKSVSFIKPQTLSSIEYKRGHSESEEMAHARETPGVKSQEVCTVLFLSITCQQCIQRIYKDGTMRCDNEHHNALCNSYGENSYPLARTGRYFIPSTRERYNVTPASVT